MIKTLYVQVEKFTMTPIYGRLKISNKGIVLVDCTNISLRMSPTDFELLTLGDHVGSSGSHGKFEIEYF